MVHPHIMEVAPRSVGSMVPCDQPSDALGAIKASLLGFVLSLAPDLLMPVAAVRGIESWCLPGGCIEIVRDSLVAFRELHPSSSDRWDEQAGTETPSREYFSRYTYDRSSWQKILQFVKHGRGAGDAAFGVRIGALHASHTCQLAIGEGLAMEAGAELLVINESVVQDLLAAPTTSDSNASGSSLHTSRGSSETGAAIAAEEQMPVVQAPQLQGSGDHSTSHVADAALLGAHHFPPKGALPVDSHGPSHAASHKRLNEGPHERPLHRRQRALSSSARQLVNDLEELTWALLTWPQQMLHALSPRALWAQFSQPVMGWLVPDISQKMLQGVVGSFSGNCWIQELPWPSHARERFAALALSRVIAEVAELGPVLVLFLDADAMMRSHAAFFKAMQVFRRADPSAGKNPVLYAGISQSSSAAEVQEGLMGICIAFIRRASHVVRMELAAGGSQLFFGWIVTAMRLCFWIFPCLMLELFASICSWLWPALANASTPCGIFPFQIDVHPSPSTSQHGGRAWEGYRPTFEAQERLANEQVAAEDDARVVTAERNGNGELREVDQLTQWLQEQRRDVCMERASANWSQLQNIAHVMGLQLPPSLPQCMDTMLHRRVLSAEKCSAALFWAAVHSMLSALPASHAPSAQPATVLTPQSLRFGLCLALQLGCMPLVEASPGSSRAHPCAVSEILFQVRSILQDIASDGASAEEDVDGEAEGSEQVQDAVSLLEERVHTLEDRRAELHEQLANAHTRCAELQLALEQARAALRESQTIMKAAAQGKSRAESSLRHSEKRRAELEHSLSAAQSQARARQAELDQAKQLLLEADATKVRLRSALDLLRTQLADMEAKEHAAQYRVTELMREIRANEAEGEAARQAELNMQRGEQQQKASELAALQQTLRRLEAEKEDLIAHLEATQESLEEEGIQRSTAEAEAARLRSQVHQLQADVQGLSDQCRAATELQQEKQEELKLAQEAAQESEAELEEALSATSFLETRLQLARVSAEEHQNAMQMEMDSLASRLHSHERLQSEVGRLLGVVALVSAHRREQALPRDIDRLLSTPVGMLRLGSATVEEDFPEDPFGMLGSLSRLGHSSGRSRVARQTAGGQGAPTDAGLLQTPLLRTQSATPDLSRWQGGRGGWAVVGAAAANTGEAPYLTPGSSFGWPASPEVTTLGATMRMSSSRSRTSRPMPLLPTPLGLGMPDARQASRQSRK